MQTITGTCVCPGTAEGRIRHFREGEQYSKGDIVVLERWLTHEVMKLQSAGALISATGGLTCHASIIARELKIPALISVNISTLKDGQSAAFDAAAGHVVIS